MSLAKGTLSKLFYKAESAYGEGLPSDGSATGLRALSFVSESLGGTINEVISEEIRPDRAVQAIRGGNITTNGSLTTEFGPHKNGLLLAHALGIALPAKTNLEASLHDFAQSTEYPKGFCVKAGTHAYMCIRAGTTAASGGLSTTVDVQTSGTCLFRTLGALGTIDWGSYTLTPGLTDFLEPGLAMEKQIVGGTATKVIQFNGVRVGGFTLNFPQEGIVRADWNLLAKNQVDATGAAQTSPTAAITDSPFNGADCGIYVASGIDQQMFSPTDDSAPTTGVLRPIREATLTFDNQFDESVFKMGDRFRSELPPGVRRVSGTFTTYFEDATEYTSFIGEGELTVQFFMLVGKSLMLITLSSVKITGQGTPVISGPGVLTMSYNFTAYKGSASAPDITIKIWTPDTLV